MRQRAFRNKIKSGDIAGLCNRFAIPLHYVASCLVCFLIEWISRHSFRAAWQYLTHSPLVFLFNALLIFATSTIAFLFKKRFFVRVLIFVFWIFLGVVNGVILLSRVTPFTGPDLKLMDDARKVIHNYLTPFSIAMIIVGIVLLIAVLVFLWFKSPRYAGNHRLPVSLLIVGVAVALFITMRGVALKNRVISNYFGNIASAYEDYGFPYCFGVTVFDTGISQPNGYGEALIGRIRTRDENASTTPPADDIADGKTGAGEPVNIIFVQLESFMDPYMVEFLTLSDDPIPRFRALSEQYTSGKLRVPVVGAGTANTEFECITGMSLRYFGAGEYPYKTLLAERTCESIPYVLGERGYRTHAIHNNEAKFYARDQVFPRLGFDTFTSEEYMTDTERRTSTGWLTDDILTDEILACLAETDDPDYIYTISVQGHGDYPRDYVTPDPPITVRGADGREQNNSSWTYFCEQLRGMDDFVGDLTDALADYPEPVVVAFYGDHLPTMGLETQDLKNRYLFQTQYLIWDNFGMQRDDEDLATYQLGSELLDRLDIHDGIINRYHQVRKGTRNYQIDLEALQYDMLYGENYVASPIWPERTLQLGVRPIALTGITQSADGSLVVEGENLTRASRLEINGEIAPGTVFLSPTRLYVPQAEIAPDAEVAIAQESLSTQSKSGVLTRTAPVPARDVLQIAQS